MLEARPTDKKDAALFVTMSMLRSARPSAVVISVLIAVMLGITLVATVGAAREGMCGDGDFRPPCAWFAVALNVYAIIGASALATMATVVIYIVRRRPPALLKAASILSVTSVSAFVLPVRAVGNKFAGAIAIIMVAPFILMLLAASSRCVLSWLGKVTSEWMQRRRVSAADLSQGSPL
jgi:hypothetical protein